MKTLKDTGRQCTVCSPDWIDDSADWEEECVKVCLDCTHI